MTQFLVDDYLFILDQEVAIVEQGDEVVEGCLCLYPDWIRLRTQGHTMVAITAITIICKMTIMLQAVEDL